MEVCKWVYESITNEILCQSTHSLVPNMLKLAVIVKLYDNCVKVCESVWKCVWKYVKLFFV